MRTITALLIACCVLAATCLPKHHAETHAAKKLVHEVEENLDSEEDILRDEPALEEDEEDEDAAPLDDEATAALEESGDNELEENAEVTVAAEDDNENEFEEGDDDDGQLEEDEEDEEEDAVSKVEGDIANLKRALEETEISPRMRKEARLNLDKIGQDVREYTSASAHRKEALKQAIKDRMEAFHLMIADGHKAPVAHSAPVAHKAAASHKFEEEEDAVARVENDVTQLEEAIESSAMSSSMKKQAHANLEAIARDAEEYSQAKSAHAKTLFREAVQKRMQALHLMLEENHTEDKPVSASAVLSDVQHIQSALKTSHLSATAKKAVRDNLSHIAKDAEELQTASEARRERLSSALKLRAKALKQQLEEEDN